MFWLVVVVLCCVVIVISAITAVAAQPKSDTRFQAGFVIVIAVAVALVGTLIASAARIKTGQVALVYNFAGKLTGSDDHPGVKLKAPWTHYEKTSVQIQREEFILEGQNSAVSKDQQPIFGTLVLNYQLNPEKDSVEKLYRTVGENWRSKLIDSRVLQDYKEVTATYSTTAITTHREQLRVQTRNRLKAELAPYSITVTDFFISNISFSDEYTKAIEAKQVQVQQAAQAQAKVAQATAEAKQAVAAAKGEATSIRLRGKALHEFSEVLQLEAIDKLAPNAQVIICTGKTCPAFLPQATAAQTAPATAGP